MKVSKWFFFLSKEEHKWSGKEVARQSPLPWDSICVHFPNNEKSIKKISFPNSRELCEKICEINSIFGLIISEKFQNFSFRPRDSYKISYIPAPLVPCEKSFPSPSIISIPFSQPKFGLVEIKRAWDYLTALLDYHRNLQLIGLRQSPPFIGGHFVPLIFGRFKRYRLLGRSQFAYDWWYGVGTEMEWIAI